MLKNILTATAALAVAALSGCASAPSTPRAFDASHSEAYNIARAGDLVTGIKDTTVPRGQMGRLTDTTAFGAAYTLSGFATPALGLSSLGGGALNLVNWLSTPDSHGARNSVIGWMPASEAATPAEARDKMAEHITTALRNTLTAMGAEFSSGGTPLYGKERVVYFSVKKDEWGCTTRKRGAEDDYNCSVRVVIQMPRRGTAPDFVAGVQGPAYVFQSNHSYNYNRIEMRLDDPRRVPLRELYFAASAQLQPGVYLYIAPGKVSGEDGKKIEFPFLLDQGQAKLFVVPEV